MSLVLTNNDILAGPECTAVRNVLEYINMLYI